MEIKMIKIIKNFYLIYTMYIILVINTTNLTFLQMLPALALMWILYFVFYLGSKSNIELLAISGENVDNYQHINDPKYILQISFVALIFSYFVVKFYTGQTPFAVLYNITNNFSTYYIYQTYFNENELLVLTIQKLPYILMLFFMKSTMYYYSFLFMIKNNLMKRQKISILLIIISFLYFSIARGTSYEIFDLSLI